MKQADFEAAIAELKSQVPHLSRNQIIVGLMKVVAMIHDGHSYVPFDTPAVGFHKLPIRLWQFSDGLYIVQGHKKYASIVGGRITRIGDAPVEQALRAVAQIAPRDNPMTIEARSQYYLTFSEILNGLGVTPNASRVPFTVEKGGKQVQMDVEPEDSNTADHRHDFSLPPDWVDARDPSAPVPLWQRHPDQVYWLEYDKPQHLLYVQYNAVREKPDESLASFFARVMDVAKNNEVDKFVFDLRQNGGGNNYLNLPIIHSFIRSDAVNQPGKLFTMIGRQTFSAAGNCVNEMRKHTNTLFVGEPSGFRPNMYGDPAPLVLPNSKVTVMLSTLWWQDNDPRDNRPWQPPDLAVAPRFEDYREGRDPALQVVLSAKAETPIVDQIRTLIDKNDPEGANKTLDGYLANPLHKYANFEQELNKLGYSYLGKHEVSRAIDVFKLNVEAYPQSWNTYDSLGEAYAAQGNHELAVVNYRKSLELNPKNQTAEAFIAGTGR